MAEGRKKADVSLEEAMAFGPSSFNEAIPTGGTHASDPTGVYRSFFDTLGASLEQGVRSLPTAELIDFQHRLATEEDGKTKGRAKLTPGEANQLYPHMSRPFSEPVDPVVAGELANREQKIQELQGIIDGGNSSRLASGTRWTLNLAMGVFDPINIATGMGVGRMVGVGGKLLGLGKTLAFDEAAVGGRAFVRDTIQSTLGNVAAAPVYGGLASGLQQEYDPATEIAYQSLIGAGIHAGAKGLAMAGRFLSPRLKAALSGAERADSIAGQAAVAKMNSDRAVDSGRVAKDVLNERNPVGSQFRPLTNTSEIAGRPLYHPSSMQNAELRNTRGLVIDRPYGNGIYLTDSAEHANGIAGSKYGGEAAGIFQVALTDKSAKILDLKKELDPEVRKVVASVFEEAKAHEAVAADGTPIQPPSLEIAGKTGSEVFDQLTNAVSSGEIHQDTMDVLNQGLSEAGYRGLTFEGGQDGAKHNVVMIFDHQSTGDAGGLVKETAAFSPDRSQVPGPTMQDVQAEVEHQQSIKSNALYDEQAHENLTAMEKDPPKDIEHPDLEKRAMEISDEIESARQEGRVTPEMEKAFTRIDEELKSDGDNDSIIKAALNCLTRGNK